MSEFLTLGIYKDNNQGYEVIAYIKSTNKFCKFSLKDIFNRKVRAWDIGAITKVEGFKKVSEYNIEILGDSFLVKYLSKNELKEFLDSKKLDFVKFIKSSNIRFSVIKPNIIKRLYSEKNRHCIELICEGTTKKFQIKDVRWVEYWRHIIGKKDNALLEEKESFYIDFLNNRETYFIGYKEVIENKNNINNRFKKDISYINIASVFWF